MGVEHLKARAEAEHIARIEAERDHEQLSAKSKKYKTAYHHFKRAIRTKTPVSSSSPSRSPASSVILVKHARPVPSSTPLRSLQVKHARLVRNSSYCSTAFDEL